MGFFSRIFSKPKDNHSKVIESPNGRIAVTFTLTKGKIGYHVEKDTKSIVGQSDLKLEIANSDPLGENLRLVREHGRSFDETWETLWGEERRIRNNYNEAAFFLEETTGDHHILTVRFRVFDDGVAFRYEIQPQVNMTEMTVLREATEFNIDVNSSAWSINAYQPDRYEYLYLPHPIYELAKPVHTPVTIETVSGHYVAIHEAALYDYGGMNLVYNPHTYRLEVDIPPLSDGTKAHMGLPWNSPWRMVIIAHSALDLTKSRMMLNLNDPPKGDFGWVKPLKFLGIWWAMFVGEWTWAPGERHGATTEHAKEYIEACVRLGIAGLLIEGWNPSWEGDWMENGPKMRFMESYDDFDMDVVSQYATEHGVEMVGHHETIGDMDNYNQQLEDAYAYLKQRNIHYIKSGHVGTKLTIHGKREWHHSQIGVKQYQMEVELAAQYGIMLNIHEPIKSTGIERTWPNLLTREGARGQEYEGGGLSPFHATTLPFTRLLAGGMDYTPGVFDVTNNTKRIASTIARQLGLYMVIYSAMTMAADRPRYYEDEYPELFKFIHDVPVNWELTVPLLGDIGKSYVVARKERDGANWFVGGITNEDARKVNIAFDFIDEGVVYDVNLYRDADDAHFRDNQLAYTIESHKVRKGDRLIVYMAPGGGFGMKLSPTEG